MDNIYEIPEEELNKFYTLKDLELALDFALIDEGALNSDQVFDYANIISVRLHSLVNGENAKYFDYPNYVTKDEYLEESESDKYSVKPSNNWNNCTGSKDEPSQEEKEAISKVSQNTLKGYTEFKRNKETGEIFNVTGIYSDLSFILDNVFEHTQLNKVTNVEKALSINGDILKKDEYKLEFAFVYGYVNKYADYSGEKVTGETGGYWITKKNFDKVYQKVYNKIPNYNTDKYIKKGYYKSAIFTGYIPTDEYRFYETSSVNNNGVYKNVAKIYSTEYECQEKTDLLDSNYCKTHAKEIGRIEIEYEIIDNNYAFKSISLYNK